MRIYHKYLNIIICIAVTSCNMRKESKTYYENGNLKSDTLCLNRDCQLKLVKDYYIDGLFADSFRFFCNKKVGKYIHYENDGINMSSGYFWNGIIVGPNYFYRNGFLRLYNEIDIAGVVDYVIKYDSIGTIIKEEGVSLSKKIQENIKGDTILMNQTYECYFKFSRPPLYKNRISVTLNGQALKLKIVDDNCHIGFITFKAIKGEYNKLIITSSLINAKHYVIDTEELNITKFVK